MKAAAPCDYCGCVGYHMWAGSGNCPGAVPEGDRDAQAAAALAALSEQNRLLRFALARYARLCARAADALEDLSGAGWKRDLIDELRKAATE